MRLVAVRSITQGDKLGKTIRNNKGQVLLSEGVELTERIIKRLLEFGINYVYIKDERTEDIIVKDAISDELRVEATTTIETIFSDLQKDLHKNKSLIIEEASKSLITLIRRLLTEIKSDQKLLTLLTDVFIYDNYIFSHSLNVTLYSLSIGQKLKLAPRNLEILGLGAMLHDVGKLKVNPEIIMKPGKLTEEEFEEVKHHSEYGFKILKEVQTLSLLTAHCAYQHHERMDGSGYPRGITGDNIHLFGKIIGVADVFDAVTSNRVYRKAMLPHEGLEILYAGSGKLFESSIISTFRSAVAIYPVGITVKLNDGRVGIVVKQNVGFSDRPIIRIIEEHNLQVTPYEVDLSKQLHLVVVECSTTPY